MEAYNRLADGSLDRMAECGLGTDGSFSLEFSSYMFQKGDTTIDHPNLVVRLFDYDDNLLWESDTIAAMNTPFELGTIDSSAECDEVWNLEGVVYYNTATPLAAGSVFVYDFWNGQRILLTQAELNTKGESSIRNRIGVQNMATSTAHQETGKFNFVFGTDKYRPFEGAGAISKWSLTINGFQNTWDKNANHGFSTNDIKDVIVHISYTARMGKEIGGDE